MLDLRRRQFLTLLLGGAAAAWPFAASSQQAKPAVIGLLFSGSEEAFSHLLAALVGSRRLALLVNTRNPNQEANIRDAEAAAHMLGEDLLVSRVEAENLDAVFVDFAKQGIRAVLVTTDPDFNSRRAHIAQLAIRNAMPLISDFREYADAGGLMSYGASIVDTYRRLGIYAGRILDGAKPAELPIEQPTKFELVINLKTAKALGLEVPPTLLARADEVIE